MPTATATLPTTNTVLATTSSSDDYTKIEGNIYFAPSTLKIPQSQLELSDTHTICPWKGKASYYNIILPDGSRVKDAAWFYPKPLVMARGFRDYVAFCEF